MFNMVNDFYLIGSFPHGINSSFITFLKWLALTTLKTTYTYEFHWMSLQGYLKSVS